MVGVNNIASLHCQENKGCIDIHDLREACLQYHLPVEPELLEQLLYFCDSNKDGNIDYIEFANFLNWKDKMKSGFPEKTGDCFLTMSDLFTILLSHSDKYITISI